MKLPEPVAWRNRETGMVTHNAAVKNAFASVKWEGLFTEAQLREALAQHEAVMRQALNFLNEINRDDNDRDFLCPRQCAALDKVISLLLEALDNK
jgi:hypothetical protein